MTQAFERVRVYLASRSDLVKGEGATEDELAQLLTVWGPLPEDFATYLREFGWVRFGAQELLGLGKGVEPHQNLLKQARRLWDGDGIYKLPRELLPVYDSGGGWFYCLSKMDSSQPVVCWAHEYEEQGEPQSYDESYPSWSEWFLAHLAATETLASPET
jgi:hypothetical protein